MGVIEREGIDVEKNYDLMKEWGFVKNELLKTLLQPARRLTTTPLPPLVASRRIAHEKKKGKSSGEDATSTCFSSVCFFFREPHM